MSPCCCCFGRRSPGRRSSGRYQGRHDGPAKSKQDEMQSPLSCNSFISEYYDAQENFCAADGSSPACSTSATSRPSLSQDKHNEEPYQQSQGNGLGPGHHHVYNLGGADATVVLDAGPQQLTGAATAASTVSVTVSPEQRDGGQLAGASDTSEELPQAAASGGAIARLASCLSILDSIRMPGSQTPTAAAAAAGGPFGSPSHSAPSGQADGGSCVRLTSRRLGGKLDPGCTLRRRDMSASVLDVREAWEECDDCDNDEPSSSGRPFMVRGADYMKTKVKVPSRRGLYRLLAADVISSDTKLTHVARMVNLQHLLRPAVDPQLPPLLVITIMLPTYPTTLFGGNDGPSKSLVHYFGLPPDFNPATFENQAALALLRRFVTNGREADGSPTRDRLKLIPRVVNVEEWAQKGPLSPAEHKLLATYNDKPILTRPQHIFNNGPGYLEVDIDIHSYQFLARKAFGAYFSRLKDVIFENAFVIQGNGPDELPEQVLGAVRMYRIDLSRNRPLRDYITPSATAALAPSGTTGSAARGDPGPHGVVGLGASGRPSLQVAASFPPPIPEASDEQE